MNRAELENPAGSDHVKCGESPGPGLTLRLPVLLALAAVVLMVPALRTGLMLDDLVQRTMQVKPADLPPRIMDTGFVSSDSGQLGTVLCDLFGFPRGEERFAHAKDYGILSWWVPEDLSAALWRPLTAFTHWLDYRVFPNAPALMHAHSIAWFALAVFLVAVLYRQIATSFDVSREDLGRVDSGNLKPHSVAGIAGLASCLFLLDRNTYFPVAFVANRGFIVSLVFGVLCLLEHHRWRSRRDSFWLMSLSALFLLLSLLANEGGASTLAFLAAYALVLERGAWGRRFASLLPAAVVVVAWRAVYVTCGFGVRHVTGYIDPGYEPLLFLSNLVPRLNCLMGGQLSGVPPELWYVLHPQWKGVLGAFFAAFSLVCGTVFLPVLLKDRVARFWAVAMLLALVPAATVVPLSKNLAFVAVGAFGLIASFLWCFTVRKNRAALARPLWSLSWFIAIWLAVAHILGGIAGRAIMALAGPYVPAVTSRWCGFEEFPEFGDRDVVLVNNVSQLSTLAAPFYRAYHHLPVPRSINSLVPGSTTFDVTRTDTRTLVLKTKSSDLFGSDSMEPVHVAHVLGAANELLAGGKRWNPGDRVSRKAFTVHVLTATARGAPSSISVRFDEPLESGRFFWLFFDWRTLKYSRFLPPEVGKSIEIPGASAAPSRLSPIGRTWVKSR